MEPVRIGIIGCGVMGGRHLKAVARSPLLQPVAVADIDPDKREALANAHGIPDRHAEGAELIEQADVEAVLLALPTCHRTALALQALGRNLHVLIEKPIAMHADEVRSLIRARGDRVAACCSARFSLLPSARAAAEVVASGVLGPLRVVRFRALIPAGSAPGAPRPAWRLSREQNGGGILVNWGCYDLDYLFTVAGWNVKPRTVLAQAWPIPAELAGQVPAGSDAETHFAALVQCEGGAVLSLERAEYAGVREDLAWEVLGERGALRMCMLPRMGKQIEQDTIDATTGLSTRVVWKGNDTDPTLDMHVHEDFAQAVREGRAPHTGLERSLLIQRITDAIYASARRGEAVAFDYT